MTDLPEFISYNQAFYTATHFLCPRCDSNLLIVPGCTARFGTAGFQLICGNCQHHFSKENASSRTDRAALEFLSKMAFIDPSFFWNHVYFPVLSSGSPDIQTCWHWAYSVDRSLYGWFRVGHKVWRAHRVAYALAHPTDALKTGLIILHSCDNPNCVNPFHLFQKTHSDNARDMYIRNRQRGRKMNIGKVQQLYRDKERGASTKDLSEKFGIQPWQVQAILRGYSWEVALGNRPRKTNRRRRK